MNPNNLVTKILCYGDSNTWGRSGQSVDRYPTKVRWTGQLQSLLGSDFEIIEEGLRSRTTNLDDNDPNFPGRNGLDYLRPCLESQNPIEVVILWLGTNDLKTKFNRQATDVALALKELVLEIKKVSRSRQQQPSQILLISPPLIKSRTLKPNSQFLGASEKSQQLGKLLYELALTEECEFLDLAKIVEPGDYDGVHLEPESHQIVATTIFNKLKEKIK